MEAHRSLNKVWFDIGLVRQSHVSSAPGLWMIWTSFSSWQARAYHARSLTDRLREEFKRCWQFATALDESE